MNALLLNKIIFDFNSIYGNGYVLTASFLLLLIASYFDIKHMKIPNKLNLTFFIIRLLLCFVIGIEVGNLYGMIAGFLLLLIPAMIKNKPMGGDIKLMTVLGFYIGVKNLLILLAGTIVFSMFYTAPNLIKKRERKDFPLAPFVLLSFISIITISFIV